MEDTKIVDLFLGRDEKAIDMVSEKYGSRLRAISCRITADYTVSEECENDTYLEAWNRIPPNEPRAYLFQFLAKIIRNISINRCVEWRRLKRSAFISELTDEMEQCIPGQANVESQLEGKLLGEAISNFLYSQPKEKRIIFMHRYYYLDSISAIAKRFGYSESKVKTMLFRMRGNLREYLIKEGYILWTEEKC